MNIHVYASMLLYVYVYLCMCIDDLWLWSCSDDFDVDLLERQELHHIMQQPSVDEVTLGPRPTAASLGLKESIEECMKVSDEPGEHFVFLVGITLRSFFSVWNMQCLNSVSQYSLENYRCYCCCCCFCAFAAVKLHQILPQSSVDSCTSIGRLVLLLY